MVADLMSTDMIHGHDPPPSYFTQAAEGLRHGELVAIERAPRQGAAIDCNVATQQTVDALDITVQLLADHRKIGLSSGRDQLDGNRRQIGMYRQAQTILDHLLRRLSPLRPAPVDTATLPDRDAPPSKARDLRARSQSLVDAMPDAALVLDNRAVVIAVNAAAQIVFNRVAIGEHIGHTARHPDLTTAVTATLATGQQSLFVLTVKTPTERHLDCAVSKLTGFGEAYAAPALLVVLQDFSEREALARMRMEFVANASHELRTPLAALSGFIETLNGSARDDPAARARFLRIMGEQAQRMTRLIDDLLLLSRVEMKAHLTPATTADLNHVAAEAVRLAAAQAEREGVTLTLAPEEAPTKFPGDHDELMQAAQNLIENAIKYGHAKGTVTVTTARERDRRGATVLRLSVRDDGPGIAAEHLPRLTERFYRVSTAASRQKGGTGLGLAIVKHIAARHRGRVEIQTPPGQGSTFSLVVPQGAG